MEPMNATACGATAGSKCVRTRRLGARGLLRQDRRRWNRQVTYHLLPMGGGFGRRLPGYFNFLEQAVKTAMALPARPSS